MMIIAVVGSGGKTTRIHKLAKYYRSLGKKVFVTTTTHMKKEPETVIPTYAKDLLNPLNENGYCMAGTLTTAKGAPIQKIGTLPKDLYDLVVKKADITLIEADGSRGMPAKIPADYEPVIPENVDEIHIVIGMSALGKTAKEVVHRLCLADDDLEIKEDTIITPLHLQKLLKKGYLEPLREQHNDTKIKVYPGQADTLYQRVIARFLQEEKDVTQIKEDWFKIQPKLVIFGAGHVAIQLLQIAKFLDFYTIMI
ncbi:selenium cofactor biosynthesis protein YqeC, partial [Anaerostipes sp.]